MTDDHMTDSHLPEGHLLVELQRSGTAEDLRLVETLAALRRNSLAQQPRPGRELLRLFTAATPARSGHGDLVRRAVARTRSAMGLGIVAAALAGTAAVAAVAGSSGEAPAEEDTRPPTGSVQQVEPAGGAGTTDEVGPEPDDLADDQGAQEDLGREGERDGGSDVDSGDDAQEADEDSDSTSGESPESEGPDETDGPDESDEADEADEADQADVDPGDELSAESADGPDLTEDDSTATEDSGSATSD